MNIYEKILELQKNNIPAALVTVIRTEGSTPRKAGTKMLVDSEGNTYDTIGGGVAEAKLIKEARTCIRHNRTKTITYNMSEEGRKPSAMICGGTMEFFIEPLQIAPTLYIFGGGHVGHSLYRLARFVNFDCEIIDDRKDVLTKERFADARKLHLENPGKAAAALPIQAFDYAIIANRHHTFDYEVLRTLIHKPVKYLGMLASVQKKNELFDKLRREGVPDELLNRVHTPVGLAIGAKTPEEIAVSIVAEMIRVIHSPAG
ncbi:putative xanthine dehydrogenase subunit A [bacterium BMS3Abin05]|nr:putative xanthine dehydrogenase subunit A [bacterium BMS3Abin05]GBE28388.1 putative xanthine dehydrogenase subunit A [bacterium BMS3Bbin03]HDK36260.1 xanthine dehydrogenase [Bacteroidota bacterium]